jgi:catecholate siderophore receptor
MRCPIDSEELPTSADRSAHTTSVGNLAINTKSKRNGKKGRKSRNRSARTGPKYWVAVGALGALVAYTPFSSRTVTVANAMGVPGASGSSYSQGQTQSPVHRFDIPPGFLDVVLNAYQKATGFQVVLPKEPIGNISSPGVSGLYTAEQALQKLLAGTGVSYRVTDPGSVMLELRGPSESIEVVGPIAPSSPKYTEPLRDTPQTITVIPKAVIEEQGATTLRDVLRNVPGLTLAAGEGGNPAGDNLTLRGFSARNDIFIDGVRDISPQSRDPFNIEQVEVVKGPASVFSGRGSTGGTINLVSKAPTRDRLVGGTLNLGSDDTRRVTADINTPLTDRIGFRFNFLAHDSGVADRNAVENQRWGVAPSLAFGLGTPTRLTLSYFKIKQDNLSDYGIPWVPATHNTLAEFRDRPAPVPRETFYGLKTRDFEKLNSDLATVKVEHDFGDRATVRNQFRYDRSTRDSMATPPRFAGNDSTTINREMRSWITEDEIWDNQTDVQARFSTGGINHTFVSGIDLAHEGNIRVTRTAPNMPTTLLNPNPNDIFTGAITISPLIGDISADSIAVYAFDTVNLHPKFELSGGLRWDYFEAEGISIANVGVSRIDRMLSGRLGAVYKPKQSGSIYAAFGTSLNPSLEGLSYGTANTAIDPEETYTVEIGSKWDLLGERLLLSGAVFRTDKKNARTPGLLPGDPPQVLDGRQRVDGLELGVTGSIVRQMKVYAAYTFLDGEIVDSNLPAERGKTIQNLPRNSFSLWTTYLFEKFTVGGGARFVGKRFGNNINTRFVDKYWTLEGMASYPVSKHLDLRLNLYNLTDAYYFDRLGGGHLVPGAGRSVSVSAGFKL